MFFDLVGCLGKFGHGERIGFRGRGIHFPIGPIREFGDVVKNPACVGPNSPVGHQAASALVRREPGDLRIFHFKRVEIERPEIPDAPVPGVVKIQVELPATPLTRHERLGPPMKNRRDGLNAFRDPKLV